MSVRNSTKRGVPANCITYQQTRAPHDNKLQFAETTFGTASKIPGESCDVTMFSIFVQIAHRVVIKTQ
jgi:hypothetical protein